jgi:hypothetical protein
MAGASATLTEFRKETMDGTQPPGIYLISALLYMIPLSFLCVAWRDDRRRAEGPIHPNWRSGCLRAALLAASCATPLSLMFVFSYLNHNGGIHGSEPSPGLWRVMGPVSNAAVVFSFAMALLGKGVGRGKLIGWALGVIGAVAVTVQLALD